MPAGPGHRPGVLDGIAFAGMFVFGIVMALLGAVMPMLSARLALGLDQVGTLFLVMNGAMLGASLIVGPLMDRLGMKAPLGLGAVVVGLAMGLVALAWSFPVLLGAVGLLGFGGGALNASTNTLVADLHENPEAKASALNLLGVFFGFGALLLPFSIGALLSRAGLAGLLLAAGALGVLIGAVALAQRFPAPKHAHGWPLADMRRFIGMPLVLALAFMLFFQSANEFMLGGYFTMFLTRDFAVPVERASYLLAGYWASIMVARLLLSRTVVFFGAHRTVRGGALLAAAGALALGVSPGPTSATVAILLTGFALGGIFPTVLGIAGAAFRDLSGTVFGILFTVALTGGMTMPWLAGHLAEAAGLRFVFVLAAANFVAVAALNVVAHSRSAAA